MDTGTDELITVTESSEREGWQIQLPTNFITVGDVGLGDVKVYIKQGAYQSIETYAHSDRKKELGMILIGNYITENDAIHVVISDVIEAKYTDASASTLTFTHETWDYVHEEQERSYPGDRIVGWQHTHPGYGIFLSGYDLFIQENFFNLPFQIAYVVDPVQETRGFFQWKNGKVEELPGYYIYDEVDEPIKITQRKPKNGGESPAGWITVLLGVFALLCLLLAAVLVFKDSLFGNQSSLETELSQLRNDLALQNAQLGALSSENSDLRSTVEDLQDQLNKLSDTITEQESNTAGEPAAGTVFFTAYTVSPGDTLLSVCRSLGVDYDAYIDIITAVNGLDDPNHITAGQILLIPVTQAG